MSGPSEPGAKRPGCAPFICAGAGSRRHCPRWLFSAGVWHWLAAAPQRARREERERRSPRGRRCRSCPIRRSPCPARRTARGPGPGLDLPPTARRGRARHAGRPGHPRAGPRGVPQGRRRDRQRRPRLPHRLGPDRGDRPGRERPRPVRRQRPGRQRHRPPGHLRHRARRRPARRRSRDTDNGVYDHDTVWDRAVGPMQFIPGTWRTVGGDLDGDGVKNPQDINDAAAATAIYLCAGPGNLADPSDAYAAVRRYNDSDSYARTVLAIAAGLPARRHDASALGPAGGVRRRAVRGAGHGEQAGAGRGHGSKAGGRFVRRCKSTGVRRPARPPGPGAATGAAQAGPGVGRHRVTKVPPPTARCRARSPVGGLPGGRCRRPLVAAVGGGSPARAVPIPGCARPPSPRPSRPLERRHRARRHPAQ